MRWDQFLGDDDEAATPAGGTMPIVPESAPGKPHVGEITKAEIAEKPFDWAKDAKRNPKGKCVVLEVAVPKCRPFEATIPCHFTTKVQALCRSARVHPPGRDEWDEQCLVGQTVTFDSVTALRQNGTEYVRVTRWHANPEPLPAEMAKPKPPARSQAAKAHREFTANAPAADDIPF